MIYIGLSFLVGVLIVISMMVNSRLERRIGAIKSIGCNFGIALLATLILACMTGTIGQVSMIKTIPIYLFFGAFIGVITTQLANLLVTKIPVVHITLIVFVGQIFTSALLDYLFFDLFSKGKVIGGILFVIGMAINMMIEQKEQEITEEA